MSRAILVDIQDFGGVFLLEPFDFIDLPRKGVSVLTPGEVIILIELQAISIQDGLDGVNSDFFIDHPDMPAGHEDEAVALLLGGISEDRCQAFIEEACRRGEFPIGIIPEDGRHEGFGPAPPSAPSALGLFAFDEPSIIAFDCRDAIDFRRLVRREDDGPIKIADCQFPDLRHHYLT